MIENPPLNALAAFEAAARLGSFTLAGRELCVTQAAVSQQVRRLEEYLGVPLFLRRAPGIRLTPDGERYYRAVSGAMETLRRQSAYLRRGAGPLCVVAQASFANRWLTPRLTRFCEACPDIDIRVVPHPSLPAPGPEADVVIGRGIGPAPGLFLLTLPAERLFPVCSPEYGREQGERWPQGTLLRSPESGEADWARWFHAANLPQGRHFGPLLQFSYMALASAAEGRGAALATSLLAAEDLRCGRLTVMRRVFVEERERYVAACPAEMARTFRVKAFFDWMRRELARDKSEFPDCFPPDDTVPHGPDAALTC